MKCAIRTVQTVGAIACSWLCINLLSAPMPFDLSQQMAWQGNIAQATSSGGRARGGSFDAPSSGSSGSGYSSPGYGGGSWPAPPSSGFPRGGYYDGGYYDGGYYDRGYYRDRGPVIVPIPGSGYRVPPSYPGGYVTTPSSGGASSLLLLFVTAGMLLVVFPMLTSAMRTRTRTAGTLTGGDLYNSIVTVSKLQVAMLSEARYIQDALTQLTTEANLESKEGLTQALQETVLAILRSPEYWTHAQSLSKTVNSRQAAAQLFEEWSIQERAKLSSETLVKIGGRLRRQTPQFATDVAPASYIVVTLLVGTEDDRPLFGEIHTVDDLKTALKRLAAVTPAYMLVYELIWAPQDASDSLTRDEFITGYADMVQIA